MLMQRDVLTARDGVWGSVGTTNFDSRSFAHNEESNICFHDRALVDEMQDTFKEDLRFCTRVDAETWRKRGRFARAQEFVAAFFQEQV